MDRVLPMLLQINQGALMSEIRRVFSVALICVLLQASVSASIHSVSFARITNNNAENVANQLSLEILDSAMASSMYSATIAADELLFVFRNDGLIDSAISEVFIDDGTIVGQSTILNSLIGSTDFTGGGANPGNLPAGNTVNPEFIATQSFSADAQGNPSKGVNPNEALGIAYEVTGGFNGVVNALSDGTLRVGMHLRSIGAAGDSDSFVNTGGTNPVPEPSSFVIWSVLGFGLFGGSRGRRLRG